jgi:hypothetical protein
VPLTAVGEGAYDWVLAAALLALGAGAAAWTASRAAAGPRARLGGVGVAAGLAAAGVGIALDAGGVEAGFGAFNLGFLLLLVSGPTLAVGLRRERAAPLWLAAFLVVVGFGALLGSVLADASLPAALAGLGLFAAGWLGLAWRLARGGEESRAPR